MRPPARRRPRLLTWWLVLSFSGGIACGTGARLLATRSGEPAGASLAARPGPSKAQEEAFQSGFLAFEEERLDAALEHFGRAGALDPSDARPHHGLGEVQRALGFLDRAEEEYRRAIALDPELIESRRRLAVVLHDGGKHGEALQVLRALERRSPDDAFVVGELALNLLGLGSAGEAVALLERYERLAGRDAWSRAHLGRAREKSGDPARAEGAYREAVGLDPRHAMARYWLGQLLVAAGRAEEGRRELEEYRRLQQAEALEHRLAMGLQRDPSDRSALLKLAQVRFTRGKAREALVLIRRARALAPVDPRLAELEANVSRAAAAQAGSGRPDGRR